MTQPFFVVFLLFGATGSASVILSFVARSFGLGGDAGCRVGCGAGLSFRPARREVVGGLACCADSVLCDTLPPVAARVRTVGWLAGRLAGV